MEPVADFDFIIGEGEEIILEVMDVIISWKQSNKIDGRKGFIKKSSTNSRYLCSELLRCKLQF